jgi:hypothetical protein
MALVWFHRAIPLLFPIADALVVDGSAALGYPAELGREATACRPPFYLRAFDGLPSAKYCLMAVYSGSEIFTAAGSVAARSLGNARKVLHPRPVVYL